MITLADIVEWCLERKKEGKIFETWQKEDFERAIVYLVGRKELVISTTPDGKTINGAIAFTIIPEGKVVKVTNIVTTAHNVLGSMLKIIVGLHNIDLEKGDWKMAGTHRTGRPRLFTLNTRFLNQLYKL